MNTGISTQTNAIEDVYVENPNQWISWKAVFAGVVIGTAIQATLSLLGIGIGASTMDPLQERNPFAGVGIGAISWMFISTIIAYTAAGWFAGRSTGNFSRMNGVLHGLVTWAASTVAIVLMVSGLLGGTASGITQLLGSSAQMAHAFGMPSIPKEMESPFSAQNSETMNQTNVGSEQANQESNMEMSRPTENQIRQAGEKAAKGAARTGFYGFVLLFLSAIAAGFGGACSCKTSVLTTKK